MAAGAGSRFGFKPKSLLQRDGESLLARQIRLLDEAGIRQAVVVLGHHLAQLQPEVQRIAGAYPHLDLRMAVNPRPDDGPGSSLRTGLAALPAGLDGVMVLLADQPLLEAADVRDVITAWRDRPQGIDLVVPTHGGQPGHPLVFGPRVRQAVAQGQAVRDWRRAHPEFVQALPADHPRYTCDVDDEPARLAMAAQHGVALCWPDELAAAPPGGG